MKIRRLLMFVLFALVAGVSTRYAIQRFTTFGSISGHTTPLRSPIAAFTRSLRPNYPYSIIPGGAYSNAELNYADKADPVVKEHYASFNVKKAQMVQLTEDRYQYASYRLQNKVYWTKKKLRLPKGEVLLTDGASFARARCGNRLSETPQTPVHNHEPSEKALSLPPMQLGTPMELAEKPPLGELSAITPEDIARFPAFLPPSSALPTGMSPILPAVAFTPVIPPFAPSGGTPPGRTPTPPKTPPANPPLPPPPVPPVIIPPTPPVSTVPEPNAVYLFVLTFVMSLYGLSRMGLYNTPPSGEKDEINHSDENQAS
jgi:hypothetical protein